MFGFRTNKNAFSCELWKSEAEDPLIGLGARAATNK